MTTIARRRRLLKRAYDKEKQDATFISGKTQPGSGNIELYEEDAISDVFLLQSKLSEQKSYSLRLKDLKKLLEHASQQGRVPLFRLQLQDVDVLMVFGPYQDSVRDALIEEYGG